MKCIPIDEYSRENKNKTKKGENYAKSTRSFQDNNQR